MKFKKKENDIIPNRFLEFLGLVTIILSVGTFITGESDMRAFFENITLINFIITFGKTIVAYILMPTILIASMFIVFDLLMILFGLNFPVFHFLWGTLFGDVIKNWWWNSSLPENLFLSIIIIYFLSRYQIEFKRYLVSLFVIRIVKPWYHGAGVSVIQIEDYGKVGKIKNGITIGFMLVQRISENKSIKKQDS